jgi:hypothetical protein
MTGFTSCSNAKGLKAKGDSESWKLVKAKDVSFSNGIRKRAKTGSLRRRVVIWSLESPVLHAGGASNGEVGGCSWCISKVVVLVSDST